MNIKTSAMLLAIYVVLAIGFYSLDTHAKDSNLRSYQFLPTLRIVISDIPCDMNTIGFKASAQRIDKLYIPGCWVVDPHNDKNIKIDWHNGDFSVFPMELFLLAEK